jgi:UDP-N-acetylglucosamine 1-carboxyvinyltransferase
MKKEQTEQQKIGYFIKELRERRGMTQETFANSLNTSQSSIPRMEKGEQNFTTELLLKISKVLDHQIVSINDSIDFKVNGGKKLHGTIKTNFSKNGSVGLLCASLLNKGITTLHGIARIEEVNRVIEILESIGVQTKWVGPNSIQINPPKELNLENINVESAIKTRSIVMLMGPLIHLFPNFKLPHAQGCNLGKRTIAAHTYALEELGVKIKTTANSYEIMAKKLKPNKIVMYESGDTACENILTAASKIKGSTTISFASANYMVQEVCFFLEALGVKIDGIGTSTLIIHGIENINKNIE